MSKGGGQLKKGWQKYEKEDKNFAKFKSTIMILGQRDSEVDKGKGTPWLKKKELKKGKVGDKKSWDSSEKRQQERETYVTLTNGREW